MVIYTLFTPPLVLQQAAGLHNEWVFEKVDRGVADFVIKTVDEQFRSSRRDLYMHLLEEKISIAQNLGLLPPEAPEDT
uniref:Uncharacterized protein n=1 Tax=Arundo donax TaxID=35708 RepID=A0A0A9BBA9_ARUDO